ncbi:MAG TPA: hypothetical protein DCY42_07195 [Chloroflexi bacterium]|nr:hypothetical protein [Chloroflexota bacterium]
MQSLPGPADLVLVAFIPQPKDLEIVRLLGWYRIPLRTAPKVIAVDWLAFYQPASFGKGHKWLIEWAAPVRGHELTTRAELFRDQQDHPRAGEEYFKIQLGPLVALPNPIRAGNWKRVTFLFTTGERLLNSEEISELTVHDEERAVLWKALRERAMQEQRYDVQDLPELPLSPEILALFSLMSGGPALRNEE